MKKTGPVFILITLVLAAAAMLLRKLELLTVLDDAGLAVFRPVTAVLIGLSVLAAVFFVLFARRFVEARKDAYTAEYPSLGLPGTVWAALSLLVQLYGAWLLFRSWKDGGNTLDLLLALLAGLAGAAWLYLRVTEWRGTGGAGSRLLGGALVTLFHCLWLIAYYRNEAPQPTLILTVYAFLALCASCLAAYAYAGGAVGRLSPRRALVFCALALYLSLVAQVRGEETVAFRLFWLVGAMQFAHSALLLLGTPTVPEKVPEGEEEPPAETPEGEAETAPVPEMSEAPEAGTGAPTAEPEAPAEG